MPRDGQKTKALILDAANKLFYAEGIRAISVDAIAAKAGITKKSLYYHFKSKDQLVTAYLESRDQPNLDAFKTWFEAEQGSVADKVVSIFSKLAINSKSPKWKGCGFLRTAGELANQTGHPAFKAGAAHKKKFEAWLAVEFKNAGISKYEQLARQVNIILDGAFASALIHQDAEYITNAGEIAYQMVEFALKNKR